MTKKRKSKRLPIISVNWVDAYGRAGWRTSPKPGKSIEQHHLPGVGILVGEDKHSIMIAPVADADDHANGFVILKANIRGKRERLGTVTVWEDEE